MDIYTVPLLLICFFFFHSKLIARVTSSFDAIRIRMKIERKIYNSRKMLGPLSLRETSRVCGIIERSHARITHL